jgi:hypothetical protein
MPETDIDINKCKVCVKAVEEWEKTCPHCGAPIYHDAQNPSQLHAKRAKTFKEQVLELTAILAAKLVSVAIATGATLAAIKISTRPPLNSFFPVTYFIALGFGVLLYCAVREIVDLIRGALGISIRYSLVWRNAFFREYSGSSMTAAILIVSIFSVFVTFFANAAFLELIERVWR